MEVSNRMLVVMVTGAILISIIGTFTSISKLNDYNMLTGLATTNTTGTASVAISSMTSLQFVVDTLSFGSGSINTTVPPYGCTMWINKSNTPNIAKVVDCNGFADNNADGILTIENTGNMILNVTLNFSANASGFIGTLGGSGENDNSSLKFSIQNNETNSCASINTTLNTWTEVDHTVIYPLCNGLEYNNNNDTLALGIYLTIPPDASGSKSLTITAQGTG